MDQYFVIVSLLKSYLNTDLAKLTARFITNEGSVLPISLNLSSGINLKFQWEWGDSKIYLYTKYKHIKHHMLSYRLPAITMRLTRKINQYYCGNDIENFIWNDEHNIINKIFIEDQVISQLKHNICDITRLGLNSIRENIRSKTTSKLFSKQPFEFSVENIVKLFNMTYEYYDIIPHIKIENSDEKNDDIKHTIKVSKDNHKDTHPYRWKPDIFVDGKMIQSNSSHQYKSIPDLYPPFPLNKKFYFHQDYKVIYDVIIDKFTFKNGSIYPLLRIKTVHYNKIINPEEIIFKMQQEEGRRERELEDAKRMCYMHYMREIDKIFRNQRKQSNQQFANKILNLYDRFS